jgi:hypothetical protein
MNISNEELNFHIGISGTYWNKKPRYLVAIQAADGSNAGGIPEELTITAESGVVEYVDFVTDLPDGDYELRIHLCNKDDTDVVKAGDGSIASDMLLNIESLEVDDIDLGTLRHTASVFKPKVPQEFNGQTITELKMCVNLGWNGVYTLPFTVPFHYWLLEKL